MARVTGRDALIAAAEQLFAERGSESVSLREVTAHAGAMNASAVQYHFGGRSGLIRAVLAKHRPGIEARRHVLLDEYAAHATDDVGRLAAALVRPLADKLADRDGGAGFLQLYADLITRPEPALDPAVLEDPTDSTYRWRSLLDPLLQPEAIRLHRRFAATRFTATELARRARRVDRGDDRLFVSELVDLVTAILTAPVSDETLRLVARHREGRATATDAPGARTTAARR